MLEEENRNCNCMQNKNISECECNEFNQTRAGMLERIKCLNFAIIELGLYLDTHPESSLLTQKILQRIQRIN